MKRITAIIESFKLDDVRAARSGIGVQGMTLTEVRDFGRQKGHTELYRGAEYVVDFLPKARLEVAVDDSGSQRIIDAISEAARTGKIGDGKIFVADLPETVRIRTGETGVQTLQASVGGQTVAGPTILAIYTPRFYLLEPVPMGAKSRMLTAQYAGRARAPD